jgi:hypothetical protein
VAFILTGGAFFTRHFRGAGYNDPTKHGKHSFDTLVMLAEVHPWLPTNSIT